MKQSLSRRVTSALLPLVGAAGCCAPQSPATPAKPSLVRVLKALADETRLVLLGVIARADQPVCVCDLVDAVTVNQPTVSHHLKLLREAGLIDVQRRGTWAYYSLCRDLDPVASEVVESLQQESQPAVSVTNS